MSDSFVHLHLHSQYSLLDGAIKFDSLFKRANKLKMPAVAITDHGNLFGAYEFYEEAKKANIKPIIGCEIYITPTLDLEKPSDGETFHLTVLCMNEKGYKNLSNLVTKGYFEGFYRRPRVDHKMLFEHSEGLIVLSGCMSSEISQSLFKQDNKKALQTASMYRDIFGDRYYLEVQATGLKEQNFINNKIKNISENLDIPMVATNDCHYLEKKDNRAHDALLCIQTKARVNDEKRLRFQGDEFYFKSRKEMEKDMKGFESAVDETVKIAERCNFEFKVNEYKQLPEYKPPEGQTLDEFITELTNKNLFRIIDEYNIPEEDVPLYKERLDSELKIICDMGFSGYFLIVSDFIYFAKKNGIPVGPGRGSAAGSLVAYTLGITDVDPIPYNLIFERFLNPERRNMPDIDVDFCTEGRDEIIKYVTQKYGEDRVAQIGTFGSMSSKAAILDAGRVLSLPYADINKASKLIPSFRGKVFSIDDSIKKVGELKKLIDKTTGFDDLIELAKFLENMVRHSSTHAAGVVMANEPIADYIPLYRGKNKEIVTQFGKDCVEKLRFVKFDILGLKTLTVIEKTVKFVNKNIKNEKEKLNTSKIPLNDKKVFEMLAEGFTRGVFQIESSGMKDLLSRLKPTNIEDIIAALALYRPGPLDAGTVDQFIKRKHGKKVVYPHLKLQEILKDTYGLFVYQEQIMKTASELAGYSLGEADILRKLMSEKKKKKTKEKEINEQRERFLRGAKENKITEKKAVEIFDTMMKFAEYAFNKSHSTAYSLITYQTAYLKKYYPVEFMASLITVENQNKINSSIAECRKLNLTVLPPDVNESMSGLAPVDGKIRFGLSTIKNVGKETAEAILKAREEGLFTSIFDFCARVEAEKIKRKAVESLIRSGAFDSLNSNRAQLFESLDILMEFISLKQKSSVEGQHSLFDLTLKEPTLNEVDPWDEKVLLYNELNVIGSYVSFHPMEKYANDLKKYTAKINTETIKNVKDKSNVEIAGVVTSLNKKTQKNGTGSFANLVIEDIEGSVEGIVFNDILEKSSDLLEKKGEPLIFKGTVETSNDNKVKLLVQEVFSIYEITIEEPFARKDNFENLKNILDEHPGESKVLINMKTKDLDALIEVGNRKVNINNEFIKKVEELLGENVIKMV